MVADLVIRGGIVVDGTGVEPFVGDVAVKHGKVVAVARAPCSLRDGAKTFDAQGFIVCPGWVGEQQAEEIHQGITTCVFAREPNAESDSGVHVIAKRRKWDWLTSFNTKGHRLTIAEKVAKAKRIPLQVTVKAFTHDAARILGLADRGTLAPGMKADVNVMDVRASADRQERSLSYKLTLVSGVVTFENGQPTGASPGQAVQVDATLSEGAASSALEALRAQRPRQDERGLFGTRRGVAFLSSTPTSRL